MRAGPVEETGDHEEGGAEDRGRCEAEQRAEAVGIVASDRGGQNEMKQADEEVRDAEQHRVVPEGARHGQGDAEHRGRRGEHRQPDATLVDVHRARQPRVDAPRPPEGGEDEHPAEDPAPRRVVREQDRDLRDREHERQVEEQLERGDLMLRVVLGSRALRRARADCSPVRPSPLARRRRWDDVDPSNRRCNTPLSNEGDLEAKVDREVRERCCGVGAPDIRVVESGTASSPRTSSSSDRIANTLRSLDWAQLTTKADGLRRVETGAPHRGKDKEAT